MPSGSVRRAVRYVHRRVAVYGAPSGEGHQRVPHAPKRPDGVPPHAGLSPEELQGLPLAIHAQLPGAPCPIRSRHKALRGFVWVDASANRVATVYTSAPLCNRRLTERRTLGVSLSRKGALCVWASPKGALCMRAVAAPRGRFRRSVYTPAYPRPLARPGGATGPTTSTAPWPP